MHEVFTRPSTRYPRLFAVVIAMSSALIFATTPLSYGQGEDEAGGFVTLTDDRQDQQFVAGERVEVSDANVSDDIFPAGQDVFFDAVSAKHVIAAGMSLSFKDITADDLILAGGQMDLSGTVRDDVVAAVCPFCPFGGRLHLADTMLIGDDARLAGRDISVDGGIGGDLYVAAQHFRLSGDVEGNARIEAERIVLVPGARIGGDLLYTSAATLDVPDNVTIVGQVRQVETALPFAEWAPEDWIWWGILFVVGILVALILLGVALQFAMPGLLSRAVSTVSEKPWASLGRGLVIAVLVPAVVALLMATIVGAPIGMVAMAGFVVLLALAFVAITFWIGRYARGLVSKTAAPSGYGSRILWTTLGILILVVVGLIPIVGWAAVMLAMIAGLGSVISQLSPLFRRADASPAET